MTHHTLLSLLNHKLGLSSDLQSTVNGIAWGDRERYGLSCSHLRPVDGAPTNSCHVNNPGSWGLLFQVGVKSNTCLSSISRDHCIYAPEGVLGVHRRPISTHIIKVHNYKVLLFCLCCTFFCTSRLEQILLKMEDIKCIAESVKELLTVIAGCPAFCFKPE